jgi:ABC-type Na+ efflux pump permease subunit
MNLRSYKILFLKEINESKYRIISFYLFCVLITYLFLLNKDVINFKNNATNIINTNEELYQLIELKFFFLTMMIIFSSSLFLVIENIVKEKENRTLEVFLTLPLSDKEIILGKIFHVLAFTYIYVLFNLTNIQIYFYPDHFYFFKSIKLLIFVFITTPNLLFLFAVLGILISSMNTSFRKAQNIAILILIPFQFILFVYLNGSYVLSYFDLIVATFLIFVINVLVFFYGSKLFVREKMIMRY